MIREYSHAAPRYLSDLLRSGTPSALSDSELLSRFAARRSEHDETAELAFAALLARHGPMVLRVCRAVLVDRQDVEDAFQATFLVLAMRARSIRRHGSVASWLHGVALRVAGSERSRAARRRRHELKKAVSSSFTIGADGSDLMIDDELTLIVHEEVGRLPAQYRAAVVLCYLEGLTHEMAAKHLGWPVGSVKNRLAWARERLRVRLTRRGVARASFPFVRPGLAMDREGGRSPRRVPLAMADATIRGALSAGRSVGALEGIVSAEAITLMEGVIRYMTNARLMLAAAAVLFAGVLAGGASVMSISASRRDDPVAVLTVQNQAQEFQAAAPIARAPEAQRSPHPERAAPAKDQGPVVVQAVVLDSQGLGLPGVDVTVTIGPAGLRDSHERGVARGVSDRDGKVRVEITGERLEGRFAGVIIWAYAPGRALARISIPELDVTAPPRLIRVTLEEPVKRTITVVGPDDRPIEGLRLFPRAFRRNDRSAAMPIPEVLRDRLTVTTDAKGDATLLYLPRGLDPRSVQISGSGIAEHTLWLSGFAQNSTLKIGRTGRLVGVVRGENGQPLAGIPVAVWSRPSGRSSPGVLSRISPPEMIRFDSQPLITGAQGAFQTSSTLLNGSTYRVSVRQDGFAPFVSDWVTLDGERTTFPAIRLRPLRKLTGQVHDRHGRPIAGARVFLPAGGPSSVADGRGRFNLRDILPDKTFVLVQQPGFRIQGWPVDPATQAGELGLTLVRDGEAPEHRMTAIEEPIPLEQARALAIRVLEPYLQEVRETHGEESTWRAIKALSTFDLARALDLFKKGLVTERRFANSLRVDLAEKLAEKDPAEAEALIEPISDPSSCASRACWPSPRRFPPRKREQNGDYSRKRKA